MQTIASNAMPGLCTGHARGMRSATSVSNLRTNAAKGLQRSLLSVAAMGAALVIVGAGLGNLLLTSISATASLAALYASDRIKPKAAGRAANPAKKGGAR